MTGHSVYQKCFYLEILSGLFFDTCHLGDEAVQKECTLVWGIIFLATDSFWTWESRDWHWHILHLNPLTCLDPLLPEAVLQMVFFFFFFNKYCHSFVRICSFTCLNVVIVILWDTKGKAPASYQCLCALELLGIMARMWTTFKSLDCVHLKCESEMSLSVNCSFN